MADLADTLLPPAAMRRAWQCGCYVSGSPKTTGLRRYWSGASARTPHPSCGLLRRAATGRRDFSSQPWASDPERRAVGQKIADGWIHADQNVTILVAGQTLTGARPARKDTQ